MKRPVAPTISVVIVNWNRRRELRDLLRDLQGQTEPAQEVIIVDSGSADESLEMVAREFPDVRVVALGQNKGLSIGRNAGIDAARSAWIAFLDNDLRILDRQFWTKARRSIADHADCGVISFHLIQGLWEIPSRPPRSDILRLSVLEQMAANGKSPTTPRAYYDWFLGGGCCLISRRTFETVGLFDPFFDYGGEEWDFAYRCHARDVRLLRDTDLWVVHTQSPRMRSPNMPMLILQNMLIAQSRYMPTKDLALFLFLQIGKTAITHMRYGLFGAFLRMCAKLVVLWPSQVLSRRAPVSASVMRRFYYLRTHQPSHYLEVARSRTPALAFYYERLTSRTPEQTDRASFVLMID